jgi:DNA polymerase-1
VQLQAVLLVQGVPARLLLQVHDELVLEVAPDALESTRELVVRTMEQAIKLSVPLVVETGVGANWMEAK